MKLNIREQDSLDGRACTALGSTRWHALISAYNTLAYVQSHDSSEMIEATELSTSPGKSSVNVRNGSNRIEEGFTIE